MSSFQRWATFFFLISVFFLGHHQMSFSAREGDFGPFKSADQVAEAIVEGNLARQISLLSLGIFGLLTILAQRRETIRLQGFLGWLLVFYGVLAFLSIAWSETPFLTLKRVIVFLLIFLGALGTGKLFTDQDILRFVFLGCLLFLFLGVADEMRLGIFQPFTQDYRFMGTIAANHQGWNCAFLGFSSFALASAKKRYKGRFFAVGFLAFFFLYLTKSRSSFAGATLALAFYFLFVYSRKRKTAVVLFIVFLVSTLVLVGGNSLGPVLREGALLGRDDPDNVAELSGRLPLWQECFEYVRERPLLGYGYHSFWNPERILAIADSIGWPAPGAHNGYLDIVLGLGIFGGISYCFILLLGLRKSLRYRLDSQRTEQGCFFVMLLFYSLVMVLEEIGNSVSIPNFIALTILVKYGFFVDRDLPEPTSPARRNSVP